MGIIEQIKAKPRQHASLFACWAFAFVDIVTGFGHAASWIAASFCICAIIDIEA